MYLKGNTTTTLPLLLAATLSAALLLPGCPNSGDGRNSADQAQERNTTMEWKITSTAFKDGERIPDRFTCKGPDVSPELTWTTPPAGAKELVLIMDDPDAPIGTWTHWIIYNLPPETTGLPENVAKDTSLPSQSGARQGVTDFRRTGYGGPCPPPGKPHRYFFKLYALDKKLDLKPGASLGETSSALKGHILAETRLMGTFSR